MSPLYSEAIGRLIERVGPPADDVLVEMAERDAGLLADARSFFERGGLDDHAVFEHGDAIEIAAGYDESFDLVVLDHDTAEYVQGFDAVKELVAPGGAVVADNLLATDYTDGVLSPTGLLATIEGDPTPNGRTRAVTDFYEYIQADPDFETYVLPIGEGVLISCRA